MEKLADEYMLIEIIARCPSGTVKSKQLEGEAEAKHGITDANRVGATVNVFNNEELKAVRKIQTGLRNDVKDMSAPWSNGQGPRLIENLTVSRAKERAEAAIIKHDVAVNLAISTLEGHILRDKRVMGTLFDASLYPDASSLRSKFSLSYDLNTVPDPENDVRAGWTDADKKAFIERSRKQEASKAARATVDLAERVRDMVGRVANRMKENVDGTTKIYRDTLIENVKDMADMLGQFNLYKDPEVDRLRRDILADLCTHTTAELRVDSELRKEVGDKAEKLLPRIGNFGRPPIELQD